MGYLTGCTESKRCFRHNKKRDLSGYLLKSLFYPVWDDAGIDAGGGIRFKLLVGDDLKTP